MEMAQKYGISPFIEPDMAQKYSISPFFKPEKAQNPNKTALWLMEKFG